MGPLLGPEQTLEPRVTSSASGMHADQERPAQRAPTEGPRAEFIKSFQQRNGNGIDPLYVGELVREAIKHDWPSIFTDTEHEAFIDSRFAAIKPAFDRIRSRTPRG